MSRQKLLLLNLIIFSLFFTWVMVSPEFTGGQQPLPEKHKLPERGAPGNRRDSGHRDPNPCDFLVLTPEKNWGSTAAANPTFWLYIPHKIDSSLPLELVLRDVKYDVVYRQIFRITQGEGIVSLQIPKETSPLQVGNQYKWQFFCKNYSNDGWIARVALEKEVEEQLQQATPRERVLIFAQQGLWFETFTELAELRRKSTNAQLDKDWLSLLEHPMVRLQEIASEPLLPCCETQQ